MREIKALLEFWRANEHQELVLCTIVGKQGSSYRKCGAKKIIALAGPSIGLLSGGCLEGEIERFARKNIAALPLNAKFSTMAAEDRFLGYQKGCRGEIEILFEVLPRFSDVDYSLWIPYGSPRGSGGVAISMQASQMGKRSTSPTDQGSFYWDSWQERRELVIIGCGPDSLAFARLADVLGWDIRFIDYREDYAKAAPFAGYRVDWLGIAEIGANVSEGLFTAVVLNTHNFEADLEIYAQLQQKCLGYLGILGSQGRFTQLLSDLERRQQGIIEYSLKDKVRSPAGILPRGESPETIALSIITEIERDWGEYKRLRDNIWTLVLAGGMSSRFGSPKGLAKLDKRNLLEWANDRAVLFSQERVVVVRNPTLAHIDLGQSVVVDNAYPEQGLSRSISLGVEKIRELSSEISGILILPMDQPNPSALDFQKLADQALVFDRVAFCQDAGEWGAPAFVPAKCLHYLQEVHGDDGLKRVIPKNKTIRVEIAGALADIDTQDDFANFTRASKTEFNLGEIARGGLRRETSLN